MYNILCIINEKDKKTQKSIYIQGQQFEKLNCYYVIYVYQIISVYRKKEKCECSQLYCLLNNKNTLKNFGPKT